MAPSTPSKRQLIVAKGDRRVVRTAVTKDVGKVETLLARTDAEFEMPARSALKRLKEYRKKLAELNEMLQLNMPEDDVEEDIEKSFDYDQTLATNIHELEVRLDALKANAAPANPPPPNSSEKPITGPKLPKLELLKFDGNPMFFQSYWDDFSSSVDDRSDITTIDKFKLLRTTLEGEALKVADGYLLTVANYEQVKDELKERYGDPEMAIHAHLMELLALPSASHDLAALQKVRDACEMHIRSLVALGMSEKTFGLVFTPIILSKLPKFVKMELYRKNGSNKWTLANLRTLLKEEIKARDKSEKTGEAGNPMANAKERSASKRNASKQPTTTSLVTQGYQRQGDKVGARGGNRRLCAFCQGKHPSWQCRTFPDAESRQRQIKGSCFSCLRGDHLANRCPNKVNCYYCQKPNHHSSLCYAKFGSRSVTETVPSQTNIITSLNANAPEFQPHGERNQQVMAVNSSRPSRGTAVVKSALAEVSIGNRTAQVRIVFDDCSTESYISKRVIDKLHAMPDCGEMACLGRFGSKHRRPVNYVIYCVQLKLCDGSRMPLFLREMKHICPPIQLVPLAVADFPFLRNLPLAQPVVDTADQCDVDILVGLDYYNQLLGPDEVSSKGIVFKKSLLGYVAFGCLQCHTPHKTGQVGNQLFIQSSPIISEDSTDVERMWRLEDLGIRDDPGLVDDEYAASHFMSTIKQDPTSGRYQVRWPFRSSSPVLSDTYNLALNRLKVLLRKHQGDPSVLGQYDSTFKSQLDMEIIEVAPESCSDIVYYMPHHAIVKPQRESTKVRIVYDASAKPRGGVSLNDSLYRGPVILADLLGLLLRFRLHKVAVISDIEKAFLMVEVQPEDRDVLRFLWVKDATKPPVPSNLIVYRFRRVPFGVVSSPFMLSATIAHHVSANGGPLKEEILSNLYVDNVFGGRDTVDTALSYYHDVKRLFSNACMNLRQWYSNSSEFVESIPPPDRGIDPQPSVLGLRWDTAGDSLHCSAGNSISSSGCSKRQVLSAMAAVFDPMGWFAPVSILAKILMQKIWASKANWDDRLPDPILSAWSKIKDDLMLIPCLSVKRHLDIDWSTNPQLHCFVDASKAAYAAVVYIRYVRPSDGHCCSDILASKARVAPLKQMTIPRLELMSVLIGVRLLTKVADHLKVPKASLFLWSDSQCVLHWIHSDSVTTVFVQNRVREIKTYQRVQFRYVRSADNPADIPSKGCRFSALADNAIWWSGPKWLTDDLCNWPETPAFGELVVHDTADPTYTTLAVASVPTGDQLFDLERFSSLNQLLRVTAWFFRFVRKVRNGGPISAKEVHMSLRFWEARIQALYFADKSSLKSYGHLGVYRGADGILRCKGRLGESSLESGAKHPILLPPCSQFTWLLIQHYHDQVMHAGPKHTLSAIRSKYWVPQGRSKVRSIIANCRVCKRHDVGPFKSPDPPNLPDYRVTEQRPFDRIGLDYLGPLLVSNSGDVNKKVWICIFTCTAVRAIHLELVDSLSAADFMLGFRRFCARYGRPQLVVSDNGSQFHAAERALAHLQRELRENPELLQFSAIRGVTWRFIPELAPWFGGFYERLVSPVKRALKRTLGKRSVSQSELGTLTLEISAILNTRPLTYVGAEIESHYLTPADFLGRGHRDLPFATETNDEFEPNSISNSALVLQYRRNQALLTEFWASWRRDYLTNLRESHRIPKQRKASTHEPAVGCVVLIKDQLPRSVWRIGRITKLFLGRDGKCRTAEVVLPSGKTLIRAIKLLYPLELSEASEASLPKRGENRAALQPRNVQQRAAARRAREKTANILGAEEDV